MLRVGAESAWNYTNVGLILSAGLNYMWSLPHPHPTEEDPQAVLYGPQLWAEYFMFWVIVIMGVLGGKRFLKIRAFQPLICLWYAPFFQVLGLVLSRV